MMKSRRSTTLDIENFFISTRHGNLLKVQSYIKDGLDVNYQNSNGWSPIMTASIAGQDIVLKCLIESGADVNLCRDKDLSSPLLTAIDLTKTSEEQCLKCVSLIISAGAEVNKADILGKTPLMAAAELNMADVILVLLAAGANINLTDRDKKPAIRWAIEKGSLDALKALLEGPALPRIRDDICHFAVNFAVELKDRYFAALIQKHITNTITEKDWKSISEENIDAILTSRSDVAITDCKNIAERHLFSWKIPEVIPLFRKHKITDSVLRHMTYSDLETIGVDAIFRKKIIKEIDTLYFQHKKEKDARGTAIPGVRFAEASAMLHNMEEHLMFMYSAFGYKLKDKLLANPKQLTNDIDHYTVFDLAEFCNDCTRSMEQLKENVITLNNILVDIGGDESKRLCATDRNNTRVTIFLSASIIVAFTLYLYSK